MVTIIDYGSGNLKSISNGFLKIGAKPKITNNAEEIVDSKYIVLPGVGAFASAMKNVKIFKNLILEHINDNKPFLGVCLGLQLLFNCSDENPGIEGLGIFKGNVKKLPGDMKIPHIGWNRIESTKSSKILDDLDGKYFYFVHSFHGVPKENIVSSTAEYGVKVTASLEENNVFATQFHPEKSGNSGLKILKNFISIES
ncbi:MAG: imidazole glycerol phosphate synthase subunit HisH [Methanobrevibacter sp.]|jgi:glutamine amidotransferase|nr:imidazole glycerol phosphate synthase subunit HisH [Candidatus Methanovirga basalitermitum]